MPSDSLRTTIRQKKPLTLTSLTSMIECSKGLVWAKSLGCSMWGWSQAQCSYVLNTDASFLRGTHWQGYGCRCLAGIKSTMFTTLFGCCPFCAAFFQKTPTVQETSKKRCAQCPSDWAENKELDHLRLGQWTNFNSNVRSWSLSIVPGILPSTVNQSINQ